MPAPSVSQIPDGARVRIRMYRQGLGDCFLLTFWGDSQPRHILIDCGVLTGTPDGKTKIQRVAKNIQEPSPKMGSVPWWRPMSTGTMSQGFMMPGKFSIL